MSMPDEVAALIQWLGSAPAGTLINAGHMHDKLARIYAEPAPAPLSTTEPQR